MRSSPRVVRGIACRVRAAAWLLARAFLARASCPRRRALPRAGGSPRLGARRGASFELRVPGVAVEKTKRKNRPRASRSRTPPALVALRRRDRGEPQASQQAHASSGGTSSAAQVEDVRGGAVKTRRVAHRPRAPRVAGTSSSARVDDVSSPLSSSSSCVRTASSASQWWHKLGVEGRVRLDGRGRSAALVKPSSRAARVGAGGVRLAAVGHGAGRSRS